jgi:hypothetical protein
MTIDITDKLRNAKSGENNWNEDRAFHLAKLIVSKIDNKKIDWDGSECEDWISIREEGGEHKGKEVKNNSKFLIFIHINLPLILASDHSLLSAPKEIEHNCQIVEFSDFEDAEFLVERGTLSATFPDTRNMIDDGVSAFSANSLYFHTV